MGLLPVVPGFHCVPECLLPLAAPLRLWQELERRDRLQDSREIVPDNSNVIWNPLKQKMVTRSTRNTPVFWRWVSVVHILPSLINHSVLCCLSFLICARAYLSTIRRSSIYTSGFSNIGKVCECFPGVLNHPSWLLNAFVWIPEEQAPFLTYTQ